MELILITLILGVLLLCAELYVPGGLLGTMGAVLLLCSVFLVFKGHGKNTGMYYLLAVMLLVGAGIYLASRYVPRSRLTRSLFLRADEKGYRSSAEDLTPLMNREGVALTPLRPAGKALIDGRRIDVVTEGNLIEKDAPLTVIEVEGMRVVVRETA